MKQVRRCKLIYDTTIYQNDRTYEPGRDPNCDQLAYNLFLNNHGRALPILKSKLHELITGSMLFENVFKGKPAVYKIHSGFIWYCVPFSFSNCNVLNVWIPVLHIVRQRKPEIPLQEQNNLESHLQQTHAPDTYGFSSMTYKLSANILNPEVADVMKNNASVMYVKKELQHIRRQFLHFERGDLHLMESDIDIIPKLRKNHVGYPTPYGRGFKENEYLSSLDQEQFTEKG